MKEELSEASLKCGDGKSEGYGGSGSMKRPAHSLLVLNDRSVLVRFSVCLDSFACFLRSSITFHGTVTRLSSLMLNARSISGSHSTNLLIMSAAPSTIH